MARGLPWLRWYPADFRDDRRVVVLSWEERAVYREALDYAWLQDGIPTEEPAALAAMLRFPIDVIERTWPRVRDLFGVDEGGILRSQRQEKDAAKSFQRGTPPALTGVPPQVPPGYPPQQEQEQYQEQEQRETRAREARRSSRAAPAQSRGDGENPEEGNKRKETPKRSGRKPHLDPGAAWKLVGAARPEEDSTTLGRLEKAFHAWWEEARAAGRPPRATGRTWATRAQKLAELGLAEFEYLLERATDAGWRGLRWEHCSRDWASMNAPTRNGRSDAHTPAGADITPEERAMIRRANGES